MEASLTCAVCLGVFREPVTLPRCSHNFCKRCVLECASPQVWTPAALQRSGDYSTVTCPLCRKVSTLSGGLGRLPINTTLAEVVRLLPPSAKEGPDSCGKSPCAEHPELRLELYCKSCERPCCGRCVSLRHQGVFHSVNLLDVTFQEEKLLFFNSLKTLRETHARLAKEISDDEKNASSILKANEDAVTSAFIEVQKALDLKKQQLLDLGKRQQSSFKKRREVREVTKALHQTTLENLLKDCEKIADDYEPRSFLQVACGLNKRMKSNLELMELCTDNSEDALPFEPQCIGVQAVLDAVSTLKMTSSSKDVTQQNGSFSFKSLSRTWNPGMETREKYCDQELIYLQGQMQLMAIRFVGITNMPEYQHLSYEELRLKHYEPSVVQEKEAVPAPERQMPIVCNNMNNFTFTFSLKNDVKSTRVKNQRALGQEHTVFDKDIVQEKPTNSRRIEQKDSLSACVLEKDDGPVTGQDS
ncbi:hypothetical protein PRIEUP_LOCUS16671 [Pristimantis euphronides]